MWAAVDLLGGVLVRTGLATTVLSCVVVLAMLGCRQPARRIALARAGLIGALVVIPLAGLAPLPRVDMLAALRDAGIWPHPILSTPLPEALPRAIARPGGWAARGLVLAYAVVAGFGLAGLLVGWWGVRRLLRHSVAPSPRAQALYDALPFASAGRRSPRLRVSDRVRRPVLLGAFRPTIVIPSALDSDSDTDNPDDLEALRLSLLHELAHAERSDSGFSLVGRFAQAAWFFLPPLRWIRAQMELDHEFLADRRASAAFGAREGYASSLLELATGHAGMPAATGQAIGPRQQTGRESGAGTGSPLFRRVLMLLRCPFPVEPRSPAWWSGSVTLLIVATLLSLACLGFGPESQPTSPVRPATHVFRVSRLALGPEPPGPTGRDPAFELPMALPARFDLTLEVWGDRATIEQFRILGRRLGPTDQAAGAEPEAWHHVRLRRGPHGLALAIDDHPVPIAPAPFDLTSRLAIEPPPGLPALIRNLVLTWDAVPGH